MALGIKKKKHLGAIISLSRKCFPAGEGGSPQLRFGGTTIIITQADSARFLAPGEMKCQQRTFNGGRKIENAKIKGGATFCKTFPF